MKQFLKNILITIGTTIFITFVLLILQSCGSGDSGGYKADSTLDSTGNPASVTNTASSPAEMSVGDVYSVIFTSQEKSVIDFSGADPSAQFILAVAALDTNSASRMVQLSDESASLADVAANDAAPWKEYSAKDALDQQLRGAEMMLSAEVDAERVNGNTSFSIGKAATTPPSVVTVGSVESFKVLGGLSSLTSYKSVRAEVKCVGENVIFYVDTQVEANNRGDLTDADVQQLCTRFDATAAREFELFGEPSDVNGDGHIAVLMTPQINRLGAVGGGIITGFFFANDLYVSSNSNQREIIYVLVPDSEGIYGTTIPKDFAMDNLLPAVLPHELQHAINYNQHVFVNEGSPEENWLNEGLSHFSEDILGVGQENPSRVEVFLDDPSSSGPFTNGSPGLAERGASYLFLRYLYEQAADPRQFIWDMLHSETTGVANLEASFAGANEDFDQLSEFLLRWYSTLVMSSYNLSSDPRFSYKTRSRNADTSQWEGICLKCDAEDGRETILGGVGLSPYYGVSQLYLEPTAAKFHQINSFPQQLTIASDSSGSYGAVLVRFK